MPVICPTCSRANPSDAAYCYYDGRGLIQAALNGPLGLGTRPFPMPFSFADGQGCTDFNQLVLACDQRWNEARGYLQNGIWKSFFGAIGRADLAALAMRAANESDPDVGFCRLLEALPADAEALRPAKLALPSTVEDLGEIEPGKDYKLQLVIENQGILLLRGSASTECEWLALGDRKGLAAEKIFQTRDTYSLTVQVLGSKLHAGKLPLEGQVVIDTNGGRETVTVRATVPIRPFPQMPDGNGALAGATSPRQIAEKAKANPQQAAVLFEQGAVKVWYESNGWTYPIRTTQARGKSALQQFFEALGLVKPPRLEIDTQQIVCRGDVGKHLVKTVVVRTTESKYVHAEVFSHEDWVKVQSTESQGKNVNILLRIDVPPRPGETLETNVVVIGNGQQRFVVPVQLTVTGTIPPPPPPPDMQTQQAASPFRWVPWALAGCGGVFLVTLVLGGTIFFFMSRRHADTPTPPSDETATAEKEAERTGGGPADSPLGKLKRAAWDQRSIFELLESKEETEREKGYDQLAAKLKELAHKGPQVRQPLGQVVADLCVHDKCTDITITPLLREVARQFPAEDTPYPDKDKGEAVELIAYWLEVVGNVIANKDANPNRIGALLEQLGSVCDAPFDSAAPRDVLKEQVETALVLQCYHNLLPTAERSIEQALTLRDVLIAKFPLRLVPANRAADDVKLLGLGLAKDNNLWPNLEPIFKTCLEGDNINVRLQLIGLYDKANAELAPKMETLLATRWKIAGNAKLTQAEKASNLQQRIDAEARAAKVPRAERLKRLKELLAKSPLSASKTKTPAGVALSPDNQRLLDTMRLTHASTMACILFNKEAEKARFDEWVGRVPGSAPDKTAEAKKPDANAKPAGNEKVHDLEAGNQLDLKTEKECLTENDHFDSRLEVRTKDYHVYLRAGEKYVFYMRSDAFRPHLRLKTLDNKEQLAEHRDRFTQIDYYAATDGEYRLVASSLDKKALGKFTLHLERPQKQQQQNQLGGMFGNGLGRNNMAFQQNPFQSFFNQQPTQQPQPTQTPTKTKKTKEPAKKAEPTEFDDLGNAQSKIRIAAFKNLANQRPKEIAYRQAKKIADFLVPTEWELTDDELDEIAAQLPAFGNYPHVLEALADAFEKGKLTKERAEALVGGLLGQKPNLDAENYRTPCRKLLLRHALELSGMAIDGEADVAAAFLREMYKEQARAFGLDDLDFAEPAPLASLLEALIKQVAPVALRQKIDADEKAFLEQIDRPLLAAKFAADNDLERTVLLQRLWIKVLGLALRERMPAPAVKAIQQDLDKKDRAASNLLEQLRFGEENILKLWGLAHNLKVQ